MSGNDLEYGWYKWQDGFRQKDGFFVDRAGRVLYWPKRAGPGYVVDDYVIRNIRKENEEKKKKKNALDKKIYFSALFLSFLIWIMFDYFFAVDVVVAYGWILLPFVGIFAWELYKFHAPRRGGVDLSHLLKVRQRRPPVRDYLIPANDKPAEDFWYLTLLCLAGTLAIALLIAWDGYNSFLRAREAGEELNWLFGYAPAMAMGVWGLAIVLTWIIRRIRARNGPYSLAYLTSRIKVADGLTVEKLEESRDVKKPPPLFGKTTGGNDRDGDKRAGGIEPANR